MHALIIDDEQSARTLLQNYLNRHADAVTEISLATSVASGLEAIAEKTPDLVFLDIKMGDGLGFDLLDQLGSFDFQLVFTTAYSEFAIRAFKYSAVDYLLKPIDPVELVNAVKRAAVRPKRQDPALENLKQIYQQKQFKRIALPGEQEYTFVELDEVVRLKADNSYTEWHLKDGRKITVSTTLKVYEEMLPGEKFFRIHQSHIVNLHQIARYIRRYHSVEMTDGTELEVSKRKRADFRKLVSGSAF